MPLTVLTNDDTEAATESTSVRRFSDADRDACYHLWRTIAGRNLALVARSTGISYRTLDDWKHRYDWVRIANEDDEASRSLFGTAIQTVIGHQALPSIMTAIELRDDREQAGKIRLEAAVWLAGLAGFAPVNRTQLEMKAAVEARSARKFDQMGDAELLAYMRRYVETGDAHAAIGPGGAERSRGDAGDVGDGETDAGEVLVGAGSGQSD